MQKRQHRSNPEQQSSLHPVLRKIKFKNVSYFSSLKIDRQRTTFTTHFTTFSPQKTIHKSPLFPKHPSKTPAKTAKPRLAPGPTFFRKTCEIRPGYLLFLIRFTTPASECSFIAATASPRTFFISALTALSSTLSQSPAVASNTSPSPICLAGRFNFAPPFGPLRCSISPALCS